MAEEKNPKEMKFGELVYELAILRDTYSRKLVDKDYPRPEDYYKCGGIGGYNQMIKINYKKRRQLLTQELDRMGEIISKLEKILPKLEELFQQ